MKNSKFLNPKFPPGAAFFAQDSELIKRKSIHLFSKLNIKVSKVNYDFFLLLFHISVSVEGVE